jgi:hypothetical protein
MRATNPFPIQTAECVKEHAALRNTPSPFARLAALGLLVLGCCISARAYPPTPYHLIYGLVKDQYGTPLMNRQAQVVLQTPSGTILKTSIVPDLAIGVNYVIRVPMDSGLTPDAYKSTALEASSTFTIVVVIGSVTNAPIQLAGNLSQLGQPAQMTRIDLTLGVDSNRDGIPDAWESAFLAAIGSSLTLADLNAGLVLGSDGRTLMQEFLLGTDALVPGDGLVARIVSATGGTSVLEFSTSSGHSYAVLGSTDLQQWSPVSFRLVADGPGGVVYTNYSASAANALQVQVASGPSPPKLQFYRIQLQ